PNQQQVDTSMAVNVIQAIPGSEMDAHFVYALGDVLAVAEIPQDRCVDPPKNSCAGLHARKAGHPSVEFLRALEGIHGAPVYPHGYRTASLKADIGYLHGRFTYALQTAAATRFRYASPTRELRQSFLCAAEIAWHSARTGPLRSSAAGLARIGCSSFRVTKLRALMASQ